MKDLMICKYYENRIGEEFEGIISSVVKFGFFVELPNTVEGLVHIQSLEDDYYHFIENHLALVGERTRRVLKVGQKVKVKVLEANPDTRIGHPRAMASNGGSPKPS